MELFLDTADAQAVEKLCGLLEVAGVTTNPTIVTKSGKTFEQVVDGLISVLSPDQKLFCQVVSTDIDGILREADKIVNLRPNNTYVKIPVTHVGMRAIKACKKRGMGVLATAIYAPSQGFLAALNGAEYLAPYVNRMSNLGDGIAEVKSLLSMLWQADLEAKVVAASFKNVWQVTELLAAGIEAVTIPVDVAFNMLDHPSTAIAVDEFSEAWEKAYGKREL